VLDDPCLGGEIDGREQRDISVRSLVVNGRRHALRTGRQGGAPFASIVAVRRSAPHAATLVAVPKDRSPWSPHASVCINRTASISPAFSARADFNINILGRAQKHLADRCNGPVKGEARFGEGAWIDDDVPWLSDAQAVVCCRHDGEFHYGTHGVFVGRVLSVRVHGEVDPLIYADGLYGSTILGRPQ